MNAGLDPKQTQPEQGEAEKLEVSSSPATEPIVYKIPSLNPFFAPDAVCTNRGCNQIMKIQVGKEKKGGEVVLFYHCTNCHYDCKVSPVHVMGQCVREGTLDMPSSAKEVIG